MTLQHFYDKLEGFDWFYHMSDDPRVYHNGELGERGLRNIADEMGKEFEDLYAAFSAYVFSGASFGTKKKPKPARPGGPKVVEPPSNKEPF